MDDITAKVQTSFQQYIPRKGKQHTNATVLLHMHHCSNCMSSTQVFFDEDFRPKPVKEKNGTLHGKVSENMCSLLE
jgi:hypothetical protein